LAKEVSAGQRWTGGGKGLLGAWASRDGWEGPQHNCQSTSTIETIKVACSMAKLAAKAKVAALEPE